MCPLSVRLSQSVFIGTLYHFYIKEGKILWNLTLWKVLTSTFGFCKTGKTWNTKPTEGTSHNKHIKIEEIWPQYWALGNTTTNMTNMTHGQHCELRNCLTDQQLETRGEPNCDPDMSWSRLEARANVFMLCPFVWISAWVLLICGSSAASVTPTPCWTCGGGELAFTNYLNWCQGDKKSGNWAKSAGQTSEELFVSGVSLV